MLSTDPFFVEKVGDVVGLYLAPPERAMVLGVDEKSQVQPSAAPSRSSRRCRAGPRRPVMTTSGTAPPRSSPPWTWRPGGRSALGARRGVLGGREPGTGRARGANLGTIRRVALSLIKRADTKGSIRTRRMKAAWDDEYMLKVPQEIGAK